MENVWRLIALKFSGEATAEQKYELLQLQYRQPQIRYYICFLSAWWQTAEKQGKEEAEKAFNKILQQLEKDNSYYIKSMEEHSGNLSVLKKIYMVIDHIKLYFQKGKKRQ